MKTVRLLFGIAAFILTAALIISPSAAAPAAAFSLTSEVFPPMAGCRPGWPDGRSQAAGTSHRR